MPVRAHASPARRGDAPPPLARCRADALEAMPAARFDWPPAVAAPRHCSTGKGSHFRQGLRRPARRHRRKERRRKQAMRDWAHHRLSVTVDAARTVARALGRGFPIGPMAAPPEHIAASSKPARVNASHAPSRRARPARPSGRQLSLASRVARSKTARRAWPHASWGALVLSLRSDRNVMQLMHRPRQGPMSRGSQRGYSQACGMWHVSRAAGMQTRTLAPLPRCRHGFASLPVNSVLSVGVNFGAFRSEIA